jgi:hypothetical protein
VLSAGLGGDLNFGTMRELVNKCGWKWVMGLGEVWNLLRGKGALCRTWWQLELWNHEGAGE